VSARESATRSGVPGIDVPAVSAWLATQLPELEPPYAFTRIGAGQSNLTYRVDAEVGGSVVLRRPPLGEILASAHDMSREHQILTCLSAAGGRVPATRAFCDDSTVTGTPFYVMQHVDGLVLNTVEVAESVEVAVRAAAGRSMASTLAELHAFDIDAVGLGDFRRPGSLASRQLKRWRSQWHASKTQELPLIDQLADGFERSMPEERETVLVHGDYHLNNVLVGPDGDVRAVLDWELCTVGDPLADVGLLLAYWSELGESARRDDALFREPVTALPGFPDPAELLRVYSGASGRDVAGVGYWVAFAYWKVAIIVEGVYRRWLNDPTNGTDAGRLQPAVARLAESARAAFADGV
jgi:aminoglycoside phosphotransferase (APT) family kinase protein